MASTRSDILLHPVRLRIVLALAGDEMTTAAIGARLPDVPQATLYRHVAALADAGLIEVVGEEQRRGTTERTYRLVDDEVSLGPEDAAAMSPEQHMAGFVTFTGALIDAFGRYIEENHSDPATDIVGYRQVPLWLSQEEAAELAERILEALAPYAENRASDDRTRILLNTILIPDVSTDPKQPQEPAPEDG